MMCTPSIRGAILQLNLGFFAVTCAGHRDSTSTYGTCGTSFFPLERYVSWE